MKSMDGPEVPTQLNPAQDNFNFGADDPDISKFSHYDSDFQFALNDSSSPSYVPPTTPHPSIPSQTSFQQFEPIQRPLNGPMEKEGYTPQQEIRQQQAHQKSTEYYHDRLGAPALATVNGFSQQTSDFEFDPNNSTVQSIDNEHSTEFYRDWNRGPDLASSDQPSEQISQGGNGSLDHLPPTVQPGSYRLPHDQREAVPKRTTITFSGSPYGSPYGFQMGDTAEAHNYYHNKGDRRRDL